MSDRIKELDAKLSNLCVVITQDSQTGLATAYTTAEPLFCFSRPKQEEVIALAKETILDYARRFYHAELDGDIQLVSQKHQLPIRNQTTVGSYLPELQCA